MNPILHKHIQRPCQPLLSYPNRLIRRKWFLIPFAGLVLALALVSCSSGESPSKPLPPPVTDTRPVGEGLKVIGFAMLGAAVVGVLGRLLK